MLDHGIDIEAVRLNLTEPTSEIEVDTDPLPQAPETGIAEPEKAAARYALNRRYAFIRNIVGVIDLKSYEIYHPRDFHTLEVRKIWVSSGSGGTKPIRVSREWLYWPGRTTFERLVYEPGKGRVLADGSLNLWRGWPVKAKKGDVSLWHRLMDHIFGGAQDERAWFERWCAYPFQRPGTKLHSAVLLWSNCHGSGKSLTGEIIGGIYGEDNYWELNSSDFFRDFNEWAANRQFILANEILTSGKKSDMDRLKALVTQGRITINRKNKPEYWIRDCISYFLTSNHPSALSLEESDRRFFIWQVERKLDASIAQEISKWAKSPVGKAALLYYFVNLDLGNFNPHDDALITSAKNNMIDLNRSELDIFVRERIAKATEGGAEVVSVRNLCDEFSSINGNSRASERAMATSLAKNGAKRLGQKRIGNDRQRPWALANTKKWESASATELDNEMSRMEPPYV